MRPILAQVGLFVDFPPLLGPAALVVGMGALIIWDYREHYLSALPFQFGRSWVPRTTIILPLGGGIAVAAAATMLRYESLWIYSVVLFLAARLVQGALLVYGFRKLAHYARRAAAWIASLRGSGSSSATGPSIASEIVSKLVGKVRRAVVKQVAVLLGVALVAVGLVLLVPETNPIGFVWAAFVMLTTATTLLVRLRSVAAHVGRLPVLGLLFCIAGAEVYNLPSLPRDTFAGTAAEALAVVPVRQLFPSFSLVDLGVLVASQLALLAGVAVALLFLSANRPR